MAIINQDNYGTIVSVFSAEGTMANNAYSAASAALGADATDAYLLGDWELVFAFGATPTAGAEITLYLVRSVDGTNYEDGGGSVAPSGLARVGGFVVRAVTTSQRRVIPDVPFPPGLYKAVLFNNGTGQTVSASYTLKVRPHNAQVA